MPVYLGEDNAEPETEGKFRIRFGVNPYPPSCLGLLKEDREKCVDHHKPAKRE